VSYLFAFLGFIALIVLHEAGHFTAAKLVGMRVEKFSLFFGPMFVKKRIGETEYGIGPIPLGGYVKITGMNPNEEQQLQDELDDRVGRLEQVNEDLAGPEAAAPGRREDLLAEQRVLTGEISGQRAEIAEVRRRSYYNQKVWKRIVVILAGPAVNIAIAFIIIWALFLANGQSVPSQRVAAVTAAPAKSVLHTGDEIVSVDGVATSFDAIRAQLAKHRCAGTQVNGCVAAAPATIVVRRNGELVTFKLRPVYSASAGRPLIGFEFGDRQQPVSAAKAASLSVTGLWGVTKQTVSVVVRVFEPQERKQLHGVVGGYTVAQESFSHSVTQALEVLALISLSLGIINLFPFLPLDGGHVFWAVAEKVRGKRIPFSVMERAGAVGFVLILLIFVIGLSNDISTLTGKGFNVP
jgi:regulator of sigma E protease